MWRAIARRPSTSFLHKVLPVISNMRPPLSLFVRLVAIAAPLATPALAQNWLPPGDKIMNGSQNMVTVNLGFPFTMPGGNVVTSLDVDEYCRLVEVGSDASDASESTAEMTAMPGASINVNWDHCFYTSSFNPGVFFYTDSTVAVISWANVRAGGQPMTCQCQLYPNGEIVMLYDSRVVPDDAIVGLCPGNGALLPAPSDLSTSVGGPLVTTDPTIFEQFDLAGGPNPIDLVSMAFTFFPTGTGGSSGWAVIGTSGISDPNWVFSNVDSNGSADCPDRLPTPSKSYTFTPDGSGNWVIAPGPSLYDPVIGPSLGLATDDKQEDIDIGFAFPWPSGATNFIDIDPNGRILPGNSVDASDSTLTPAEHAGAEAIAAWATDIEIYDPLGGNIHIATNPGISATITWNAITQYEFNIGEGIQTFQVQMFPDGSFVITHQDINEFNVSGIPAPFTASFTDDLLVGFSDGSGVLPAELDLSAPATVVVPIGVNYEYWDSSGLPPGNEPVDLINLLPHYMGTLVSLTNPVAGTNWSTQIQDSAASAFGFYLIGFGPGSVSMDPFGSPCNLLVDNPQIFVTFSDGLGGQLQIDVPIPNAPSVYGAELFVQGAIDAAPTPPYSSFAGLPWTISFTNSLVGTVGNV